MKNQKNVLLKSGKHVKIKLPPMTFSFMEQLQKMTLKEALVNPELLALLSPDEAQELYLLISDINVECWREYAETLMKRGVDQHG